MTRKQKLISDLHYPLWLLKDFMWMIKLPIISFILAVPTIIISIYTKNDSKSHEKPIEA